MPLSMPTIMAGINQTIMMALAMVVIASMIGVKGLGQPVLKSIYWFSPLTLFIRLSMPSERQSCYQ